MRERNAGKERAHFLHIGKTAGSALKSALEPVREHGTYELVLHGHDFTLVDVPAGERVFFVIRDPIDRFVSGFYSRQRQGRPRYTSPWSPGEKLAFERFPTAEALAASISSPSGVTSAHAAEAMASIQHVRDSYWRWFRDPRYFRNRLGDVLAIASLCHLTSLFPQLCALLGVPGDTTLPDDDIRAHRNPANIDRNLSALARTNLETWYRTDYEFVDFCRTLPSFLGG